MICDLEQSEDIQENQVAKKQLAEARIRLVEVKKRYYDEIDKLTREIMPDYGKKKKKRRAPRETVHELGLFSSQSQPTSLSINQIRPSSNTSFHRPKVSRGGKVSTRVTSASSKGGSQAPGDDFYDVQLTEGSYGGGGTFDEQILEYENEYQGGSRGANKRKGMNSSKSVGKLRPNLAKKEVPKMLNISNSVLNLRGGGVPTGNSSSHLADFSKVRKLVQEEVVGFNGQERSGTRGSHNSHGSRGSDRNVLQSAGQRTISEEREIVPKSSAEKKPRRKLGSSQSTSGLRVNGSAGSNSNLPRKRVPKAFLK